MKMWELVCVDRETGAESLQRIPAADEKAAYAIAADRGLMVAKVAASYDVAAMPRPEPPKAAHMHVGNHSGTVLLYIGGGMLASIGALVMGVGVGMDTTVASAGEFGIESRTHNIGLLNMQTCTVIAGSAMFLGGVILLAVARIIGQLFRWGRPIVAYLEAANTRA